MTASLITKDTHPIKDFTSITQIGLKAYNLAQKHQSEIEARLPGTTAALQVDLDALGVVIPGAMQARHEAKAATEAQNALTKQGHTRVKAIRTTVRKSGAPKDVQRAYGVGQATSSRKVGAVKAALQQIADRASSAPAVAAGFGVVPSDVTALVAFIATLSSSDTNQETKRAGAPLSTKERNLTANRVLQTAALIAGTGMRAFADDPVEYASFEALMASTMKPKKSAQPKAQEVSTASATEGTG